MKLATQRSQCTDLALCEEMTLAGLLGMPNKFVILSFRGTRIRVIAAENPAGQRARLAAAEPVTDPLHLELLTGSGEAPDWPRPVLLQAIIETRSDPVLAVQRASRWASYCARVAIVPQARLNDRALLEARLRGVWVVTAGASGQLQVAVSGERAAAAGSVRGLVHRLLDELIWEALREQKHASTVAVRSAATR
jgi:hypothetical protein